MLRSVRPDPRVILCRMAYGERLVCGKRVLIENLISEVPIHISEVRLPVDLRTCFSGSCIQQ